MKKFLFALLLISFIPCHKTNAYSLETKGKSGIVIDADTGKILWEKNRDLQVSVASTTKIMTAIVALEYGNLDDLVTVSKYAASMPSTKMYLKEGEVIRLEYLLYALLLQSSNDAAAAIADHIAGTEQSFATLMTNKAKEIGADNTLFITSSGLDNGINPYSTAYDLCLITRYALKIPEIVEIMNTENAYFSSNLTDYYAVNQNLYLKEKYPTIIGKTGYTNKAGHCFVSATEYNGRKFISVILGSDNKGKWEDTEKILDYVEGLYSEKKFNSNDISFDFLKSESYKNNGVYLLKESLSMFFRDDEKDSINITINELVNSLNKISFHEPVAEITVKIGDITIMEKQLTLYDDFVFKRTRSMFEMFKN